jgi:hypothetical protein
VNRLRLERSLNNLLVFGCLGLVGGLAFDGLRATFDVERTDAAYAVPVFPIHLALVLAMHDKLTHAYACA